VNSNIHKHIADGQGGFSQEHFKNVEIMDGQFKVVSIDCNSYLMS
jgi:hypothetical protein